MVQCLMMSVPPRVSETPWACCLMTEKELQLWVSYLCSSMKQGSEKGPCLLITKVNISPRSTPPKPEDLSFRVMGLDQARAPCPALQYGLCVSILNRSTLQSRNQQGNASEQSLNQPNGGISRTISFYLLLMITLSVGRAGVTGFTLQKKKLGWCHHRAVPLCSNNNTKN